MIVTGRVTSLLWFEQGDEIDMFKLTLIFIFIYLTVLSIQLGSEHRDWTLCPSPGWGFIHSLILSSGILTSSSAHTTSASSMKPIMLDPAGRPMRRKSSYMTFQTSGHTREP